MSRAQVAELFALQQLDSEIERAAIEHEALGRALAGDPVAPTRAAAAQGARIAQASATRMRQAEAALEETRERLKRQESRLYGGQVAAKDAGKAQAEIEHLKALSETQEEALLTAMLEVEEAQANAERRKAALSDAERVRERERGEQAARMEQVAARLAELRATRERQAAALAPESLTRYEAVRRAHGGRAVAEVRGNVCTACRVSLTPSAAQRARVALDLPLCDNCGRILYLP